MKLLFIPCRIGVISHGIPLLALARMLPDSSVEKSFLLPRPFHKVMTRLGANVLDIDYNGFRSELAAYSRFCPDIVVDDCNADTGIATALTGVRRITIQRTGIFPGTKPRNGSHTHSMQFQHATLPDLTSFGVAQPKGFIDLFNAELKIVPGIRSIEVLPSHLEDDPSYIFSGPLIIDDYLLGALEDQGAGGLDLCRIRNFSSLEGFFKHNEGRRKVYITFGNVARPTPHLRECIEYLLASDIAVVSNVALQDVAPDRADRYYYARYLPMHYLCSNVELVVHHCGSGTYHYPIIHNVPTITIGTKSYDRDDVAARLEELGISIHIPAPDECEDFVGRFKEAVRSYFDESGAFIEAKKRNIDRFKREIEETSSSFNFSELIAGQVAFT
jgi:hypothetical protein